MSAKVYTQSVTPLATNWWSLALRGVVAILFGVLTFLVPHVTIAYLVYLFGIYAFLDGALSLAGAFKAAQGHDRWWGLALVGIVGILAGIVTFLSPGVTALTLLTFVGVWAILSGVFHIVAAVRLRKHMEGEWLLALSGLISVLFGLAVIFAPALAAVALVLWLGIFALGLGLLLVMTALRVRSLERSNTGTAGVLRPA